ncbi:hypothetical protein KQI84_01140 [bacterium]|nr:hypothetical protein [bacterium]
MQRHSEHLRLLGLLLLFVLGVSIGQAADLTINAVAGYGGYYRPGKWAPVVVSIDNRPREGKPGDTSLDFEGRLIIETQSFSTRGGQYQFTRDVTVPAFSTQRFVVYAKFPENTSVQRPSLEVRASSGRRIQVIPLDVQPLLKNDVLMVTVSEQLARLYFPVPRSGAVNFIKQADMSTQHFPDHWAGYDSVDILVFPRWPEGRLTSQSVDAIRDWVNMGGTLVFLGGSNSNSYASGVPEDLLPVMTESSAPFLIGENGMVEADEDTSLLEENAVLVSRATVREGASVLVEGGKDIPLLVRRPHGRGQILFIAFDLETLPEKVRNLFAPYWMGVQPIRNVVDWRYALPKTLGELRLIAKGTARPPNVALIIMICVLYTVIVGPVNFFILNKRNWIQWAWLTVPLIVLIFSGLIYTIGTLSKGGKYIAREMAIMQGTQGQDTFNDQTYVGIFVPSAGNYSFWSDDPKTAIGDSDRWFEMEGLERSALIDLGAAAGSADLGLTGQSPDFFYDGTQVNARRWPLRTFDTAMLQTRGPRKLDGALDGSFQFYDTNDSYLIEGDLINNTGRDFYAAGLFFGGRVHFIGELRNKESRSFQGRDLELWMSPSPSAATSPWRGFSTAVAGMTDYSHGKTDEAINRENAEKVLNTIFNPGLTGELFPPEDGRFWFVGLSESEDLTVNIGGFERDLGMRSEIVMVELNLAPPLGDFRVPEEIVQVRLHDYTRNAPFTILDNGDLEMQNSQGVVSYEMPFNYGGLAGSIVQPIIREEHDTTRQEFNVSIYDNERGNFLIANGSQPIRDRSDNIIMPYSGRGFALLESKKPDEKTIGSPTTVTRVKFRMQGYGE